MCSLVKSLPSCLTEADKNGFSPIVVCLHLNPPGNFTVFYIRQSQMSLFFKKRVRWITVTKYLFLPSLDTQRNQKHFFRFFLVVAGGRTSCGESCCWGVVAWGVVCGEPSGGSPTFQVRTTCPSCRRKSCSTLKRGGKVTLGVSITVLLLTWGRQKQHLSINWQIILCNCLSEPYIPFYIEMCFKNV